MKFLRGGAVLVSAFALALLSSQAVLLGAPGFGTLRKKVIQLQVRRPAAVRLSNTSIGFKGKVATPEYSPVLASLEATLETELVSNERTLLKKSPAEAEWVVELTVTGFSNPPAQKRTERLQNNSSANYLHWTGSLNVAYQVVDKKGAVHDADNVRYSYDREFQEDVQAGGNRGFKIPVISRAGPKAGEAVPHSIEEVRQIMLKQVVAQIGSSLGNTTQAIEAQVAIGETHLDRAANFIDQRLWARAIEELEKTEAFPKLEDESFRQYDLGLSYEAMSYNSESYADQRNNLFKALEFYDKALELNPGQKSFVEVVARTKESVARYRKLDAMKKDDQQRKPAVPAAAVTRSTEPAKTARKGLSIGDVVEMFTGEVPQAQIVELIRESPADYDLLDKDTVLAIAKAKLPVTIQNAMRKKVGMAPLSDPAAPRPAPAAKATPVTPAAAKPGASGQPQPK